MNPQTEKILASSAAMVADSARTMADAVSRIEQGMAGQMSAMDAMAGRIEQALRRAQAPSQGRGGGSVNVIATMKDISASAKSMAAAAQSVGSSVAALTAAVTTQAESTNALRAAIGGQGGQMAALSAAVQEAVVKLQSQGPSAATKAASDSAAQMAASVGRLEEVLTAQAAVLGDIAKKLDASAKRAVKQEKRPGGASANAGDVRGLMGSMKDLATVMPMLAAGLVRFAIVPAKARHNFTNFVRELYLAATAPGGRNVGSRAVQTDLSTLGAGLVGISTALVELPKRLRAFASLGQKKTDSFIRFLRDITTVVAESKSSPEKFKAVGDMLSSLAHGLSGITKSLILFQLVPKDSGKRVGALIGDIGSALADVDVKKMAEAGAALREMASGIFWFGFSLAASTLFYAVGALGSLIIVPMLTLYGELFTKLGEKGKEVKAGAEAVGWMGLAVFAFSGALLLAGQLAGGWGAFIEGASMVVLGIAAFAGVFYLIGGEDVAPRIQAGAQAIAWTGLAMASVALGIASFQLLGIDAKSVLVAALAVALVGVAFAIAGAFAKQVEEGAAALVLSGVAIASVALGLAAFKLLKIGWEEIGMAAAAVVGVGVVMGLAGLAAPFIILGAAAIGVAGLGLMLLAGGIFVFDLVYKKAMTGVLARDPGNPVDPATGTPMINLQVVLDRLASSFAYAGRNFLPMILGGAAIAVAALGLVVLAAGLFIIDLVYKTALSGVLALNPNVKDEDGQPMVNLQVMLDRVTASFKRAGLWSPVIILGSVAMILSGVAMIVLSGGVYLLGKAYEATKGSKMFAQSEMDGDKTNFEVMMSGIANGFILGPLDLLGMYAAGPAWIMAGLALITVALGLGRFQKIVEQQVNVSKIGEMVNKILTSVASTFANVKDIVDFDKVKEGIDAVAGVGNLLTGIAEGVAKMAELKFPIYGKDGKITGYFGIGDDAFKKVSDNITLVIKCIGDVLTDIGKNQGESGGGWFSKTWAQKGAQAVKDVGGDLLSLADFVQKVANLTIPEYGPDGRPTGKVIQLTNELGDNGIVRRNIISIITSIAGALSEVGKGDTGWFSKGDARKGADAIKGIGADVMGMASMAKDLSAITNFEAVKSRITEIITLIPTTLIDVYDRVIKKSPIKFIVPLMSDVAGVAQKFVDVLKGTAEAKITDKTGTGLARSITAVLAAVSKGGTVDAGMEKTVGYIERLAAASTPMTTLATSLEKIAKSFSNFAGSFKKMSVEAVEASDLLIQSLVVFSNAKPDAFASLSDKGMALLKYIVEHNFSDSDKKSRQEKVEAAGRELQKPPKMERDGPGETTVKPPPNLKLLPPPPDPALQQLIINQAAAIAKMTTTLEHIEALLGAPLKVIQTN